MHGRHSEPRLPPRPRRRASFFPHRRGRPSCSLATESSRQRDLGPCSQVRPPASHRSVSSGSALSMTGVESKILEVVRLMKWGDWKFTIHTGEGSYDGKLGPSVQGQVSFTWAQWEGPEDLDRECPSRPFPQTCPVSQLHLLLSPRPPSSMYIPDSCS